MKGTKLWVVTLLVIMATVCLGGPATAEKVLSETGATFVHPYNDHRIIAGQGTAALELLEDVPDLDMILAPVGGGGLLSGTALATAGLSPRTRVVAAEPEGRARC